MGKWSARSTGLPAASRQASRVRVVEVDRDRGAVIGVLLDDVAQLAQPQHGLHELLAVGVHERDVEEPGVPGGGPRRPRALPRVDRDVMVIVARGQEDRVDAGVARIRDHLEAERVAVERERTVEVGNLEVDVSDSDGRVDRGGLR